MILDRTHRIWAILSAAILMVATAIFVRTEQLEPHGVTGGSLIGLAFGIVGSAFMFFAGLLALRKRVPTWRIGSAQFWLRGHIWLGLLSVPLILFHSGFGWGGLLENVLWITFAVVIVSGVYGLIVQQLLPRWMTVRVPDETFGEQIPHRCRWLLVESDKLVAELSGRLDVPVDGLRDVAFDLAYGLGKLRNGKEEEDLAKFLSAIYATSNGDVNAPPLAPTVVGVPPSGGPAPAEAGTPAPATATSQPADRPLSKIEQMRAAAAAKKAAAAATAPTSAASPLDASAPASEAPTPPTDKPLSKIEQMRAAAAAKKAQAAGAAPAPTAPSVVRRTAPEASPAATPVSTAMSGATGGSSASAVASRPEPSTGRQAASGTPQSIPRADEVRAFYLAEVRPFLDDRSRCRGPLGAEARSRGMFAQLRASLPDELHPALGHLETCCDERRQFELQRRLHRWLHGWLLVHIPATLVLLVLFVAHVVMSLRVVPWSWPGR